MNWPRRMNDAITVARTQLARLPEKPAAMRRYGNAGFDLRPTLAAMGVPDVERLTYREVQERRELIKQRLEEKRKRA